MVKEIATKEDDRIYIEFGDTKVQLYIGHNDVGISIDVYSQRESEGIPVREYQIHFDDIHEEAKKI